MPAVFEQKYILIDKVTKGAYGGGFTAWNWFSLLHGIMVAEASLAKR